MSAGAEPVSGDKILQEILESDWTLGALKRREDARRSSERGSSPGGADVGVTRRAHDGSGNNWVAEAFRRRQEEERAKAASHQSRGPHMHAASKEVPVDNWLIEGFKRHQQEERRRETIARPDEAEARNVGDDHSLSDLDSSPSDGGVVVERISLSEDRGSANEDAIGANNEASATALAPLVSRHDGTVLDKPARRAGRTIMIAGLVVVGGLVSVIGVKTLLFGSVDSTKRAGAPGASPPTRQEKVNPSQSALPKAETGAPAAKSMEKERAPTNDATPHPSSAAPAGPSDAAIIAAPPAATPESSKPNPVAPGGEQGGKARSPSQEREQGDKALHGNEAAPAATLPAPAAPAAPEAAAPAKPDKNSTAEPATVAPERSREQIRPEQEQNASESKRGAVNTGADAKPKHQAKDRNASHQTSRKPDGFSTFLKRTANSVRKFFGRLGEKQ
ncbi:hypothetical protein IYX23_04530 [Methylocystis sp. L43]|uniref:hypothetical protein n=1 Tax=unclassified Methylocystis TaxID=2625913 RepID=UPI0018C30B86|nr:MULTISPECIES: hypothetical protein [unclassified Methylocystis]MBG0796959.1 hypothetical protein [Methylocystis sp. L43]MBG0804805.1 hypothetical protein [Methylocystis sp. H15]